MTMPADLGALLQRIEAATGPDRELDATIYFAIDPDATKRFEEIRVVHAAIKWEQFVEAVSPPPLTESIDAALGLVERVKPGWRFIIDTRRFVGLVQAKLFPPDLAAHNNENLMGDAPTAPLAILAALVRALIRESAHV